MKLITIFLDFATGRPFAFAQFVYDVRSCRTICLLGW
jgi:hypothetical protein